MENIVSIRKPYHCLIILGLTALLFTTSCLKDKKSDLPTESLSYSDFSIETSGDSVKTSDTLSLPNHGEAPGGFQPPAATTSDHAMGSTTYRRPVTSEEGTIETDFWLPGEFVWWSDQPELIILRQNDGNPVRDTRLHLDDKPIVHIYNWSAFDALRDYDTELRGTLIFDKELNTAELELNITPLKSGVERISTSTISKAIKASVDFRAEEFSSLSFSNINHLSSLAYTEDWLLGKLCDIRAEVQDFIIEALQHVPVEDLEDISYSLENEAAKDMESVIVELTYEPTIHFFNPRKELGNQNNDTIVGNLMLSHNLMRGQLEIYRRILLPDGSADMALTEIFIDFSTAYFSRSDSMYQDKQSNSFRLDYPDAVLFELAESMRSEILAQIPQGIALHRDSNVTGE